MVGLVGSSLNEPILIIQCTLMIGGLFMSRQKEKPSRQLDRFSGSIVRVRPADTNILSVKTIIIKLKANDDTTSFMNDRNKQDQVK